MYASPVLTRWACRICAIDFTLAFAVVHEFPDPGHFFAEVAAASKPGAALLLAEPKGHVKLANFDAELEVARCGL